MNILLSRIAEAFHLLTRGKKQRSEDAKFSKCRKCRNRYPVPGKKLRDALPENYRYDFMNFCSVDHAYEKPAGTSYDRRKQARGELLAAATVQINQQAGGEPRRQRRLMARRLAQRWWKERPRAEAKA